MWYSDIPPAYIYAIRATQAPLLSSRDLWLWPAGVHRHTNTNQYTPWQHMWRVFTGAGESYRRVIQTTLGNHSYAPWAVFSMCAYYICVSGLFFCAWVVSRFLSHASDVSALSYNLWAVIVSFLSVCLV